MNVWQKLHRYPPVLVRLLARQGGRAMTDAQIAEASLKKLTLADVKQLSYATQWDDIPVCKVRWFLSATNVDIENRESLRNLNRYMRNPQFKHLRAHRQWPYFKDLLAIYAETLMKP
jgi:hypothetical protein